LRSPVSAARVVCGIEWIDLPTDVQRRLFEHAASGKSHDAALLKARIARFLHNHKDDWAAR
jgi:hypothetical protein